MDPVLSSLLNAVSDGSTPLDMVETALSVVSAQIHDMFTLQDQVSAMLDTYSRTNAAVENRAQPSAFDYPYISYLQTKLPSVDDTMSEADSLSLAKKLISVDLAQLRITKKAMFASLIVRYLRSGKVDECNLLCRLQKDREFKEAFSSILKRKERLLSSAQRNLSCLEIFLEARATFAPSKRSTLPLKVKNKC